MDSPEILVIVLNLVIVLVAYLSVYPKLAGSNYKKIAFYDILLTGFALIIVGTRFWGTGYEFNLLVLHVNWFWYTFFTYLVIEIPIMLWYFKKNNVVVDLRFLDSKK